MYSNRNETKIFVPTIQHYNRSYTLTVRRTKRRIFIPFVAVVWMTTTTVFSTISGNTCNIPSSQSLSQRPHQQVNPIFRVGNDNNNIKLRFCIDCEDGTGNVHNNEDTVVNSDTGCSEVLQQQQQQQEEDEQSDYGTYRTTSHNNIAIPHGGSSASVSPSSGSPDSNSSIRDIHDDDSNHDSSNNNYYNSNDLTTISHQILQEFHTEVQQIMKMNLITLQQLVTNVTNEIRSIKDEQRRLSLEQQQQQHEQQGTSTDTSIDSLNSTTMDGVDVPNTPSNINDSNAIIDSESDSLSSTSTVDDNSIDVTGNTDEQIPVDFIPSLDDSTNDTITTLSNDTTSIHVDEDIDTTSKQLDEDIENYIDDSSIAEPAKVKPTDNYNFDDDEDYLDLDKPIATSKVSISSSTTTATTANGDDVDIVDDLHQNTQIVPKKKTKIGKKKKRKNNNSNKSTIVNTPTVVKPKNKHKSFIPTSTTTDVNDDDDDLSEIEVVNDNVESEDEIDDIEQLPTTTEVLHRSLQKLVKSIITSVLFCFLYIILKRFVHILLRGLGVQLQSSSAIMDQKSQDGSTAKTILPKP